MKLLLDLLPVVVFFGAFRIARGLPEATVSLVAAWFGAVGGGADQQLELSAIILATLSAIVATVLQIGWLAYRRARIKPAVWISAGLIVFFGGLTIWLHNEWFIKWKPSILYWTFAAILLAGKWFWRRNLLGNLLSEELDLPARIWDRLLYSWAGFFLVLGAANLLVAYTRTTGEWVNFKTFGLLGLTLAFSILSTLLAARHMPPAAAPAIDPGTRSDG